MKRKILIIIFLLFTFLCSCSQNVKTYSVSIIGDYSYIGNKNTAKQELERVNLFFEKYNIGFEMLDYMNSDVMSKNYNLSTSLDNFKNYNYKNSKATILFTGKHSGSKVGISFKGEFGNKFSCIVLDMGYENHEYVLIHEILHLMGLSHSDNPNNIMFHQAQSLSITKDQEEVILQYGK